MSVGSKRDEKDGDMAWKGTVMHADDILLWLVSDFFSLKEPFLPWQLANARL
jgi:hypothetical protein